MFCPIMSRPNDLVKCQEQECAWWEEICVNPKAGKLGWLKGCLITVRNFDQEKCENQLDQQWTSQVCAERQAEMDNNQ